MGVQVVCLQIVCRPGWFVGSSGGSGRWFEVVMMTQGGSSYGESPICGRQSCPQAKTSGKSLNKLAQAVNEPQVQL